MPEPKPKKAGPAKAAKAKQQGAKGGKGGRRIDFALFDLTKLTASPNDTITPTKAKALIKSCLVVKTKEEIFAIQDEVVAYGMSSFKDKEHRPVGYLLHFFELKKANKMRYVLTNTYWFHTPQRLKEKYDYYHRMDYAQMVRLLPRVIPRDYIKHFHVDEAVVFRALFQNKACKQSVYSLFKKKQGMILYDDSQEVQGIHAGEVFDIGYFYEACHLKRDLDFTAPPRYAKYGNFLRKRGFSEQGRLVMPSYLKDGDTEPRFYNRKEHRWYTTNFNNKGWTVEDMKKKRLIDVQPLFKYFPHKTRGNLRMVEDVWISVVGQDNIFELFSSRLHMQFKKELSKLHLIDGNEKRKIYLALFLVNLYLGYCDLHTFETVFTVMEYIREQGGWFTKVFGDKSSATDKNTYKLKCCDNEEHFMNMGPYRAHVDFRRVTYVNKTTDGECCYRWMMGKCLPELKIEN